MLRALAAREVFGGRAALVVAHPDDETIALGGSLHLLPGVLLVHVTDGAPLRLEHAAWHGFDTVEGYAAAREAELGAALALVPKIVSWPGLTRPPTAPGTHKAGSGPPDARPRSLPTARGHVDRVGGRDKPGHDTGIERIRLGIPDQDAVLHLRSLTETLKTLFRAHAVDAVLTHAYEGGHPDHDAIALAVHRAADGIPVFEFAGYHAAPGHTVMQRFLPGPPGTTLTLPPDDATRKRLMLACFRTQAEILSRFDPTVERLRPVPAPPFAYDFTQPPHPGPLNYETWGWALTGARWRALAAQEMSCAA